MDGTMSSTGTVKWFDNAKGYGFITPDEGGADCFVHHRGVVGTGFKRLSEGQRVQFDRVETPRGPSAEEVVVVTP
jgi:cold shock protein